MLAFRAIGLVLALLVAQCAWAENGPKSIDFSLKDGRVRVDYFSANFNGKRPAVVVLSGARGYLSKAYEQMAKRLNQRGIDAYLLHYLSEGDLSNIVRLSVSGGTKEYYAKRMKAWNVDLRSVLSALRQSPPHSGQRVGVFGLSLGAMILLQPNEQVLDVDAIAVVAGSPLSKNQRSTVVTNASIYLAWGGSDRVFSLASGKALRDKLLAHNKNVTFDVYPNEGHQFFVEYDNANGQRAMENIVVFFERTLRSPQP